MPFIMPMEGDLKMFDINELKKDLYRSKNMAKFSHYEIGNVYYMVDIAEGKYQFPIATVEKGELPLILQLIEKRIKEIKEFLPEEKAKEEIEKLNKEFDKIFILSEDLGITPFYADIRGSELIRWIQKAIKNEQFIKIG